MKILSNRIHSGGKRAHPYQQSLPTYMFMVTTKGRVSGTVSAWIVTAPNPLKAIRSFKSETPCLDGILTTSPGDPIDWTTYLLTEPCGYLQKFKIGDQEYMLELLAGKGKCVARIPGHF